MRKIGLVLLALFLPCLAVADVTVTMKVKRSGMMGMVDSDLNEKVYFKGARIRTESLGKTMGMGGMAHQFEQVEITRLDKGVVWLIDEKDSTYSEIKIDEPSDDSTEVEFAIKDLKVTKTDNKRSIAGYECKEVKVEFTVVVTQEESSLEQKVRGSLWVAKEDEKLKELNEFWEKGFIATGKRMGGKMDAMYKQFEPVLKDVGGVALASEILIEMAMADRESESEYKEAMEMMKKFIGEGKAGGKTEEPARGMKVTTEVTSISTGKLSDNLFEIPKGYRKID